MNTPPHRFTSRTISTIFLLNDPSDQDLANEIRIEPIKGTTSILTLIKRTFLLDVNDLEIAAKLFKCAGQILSSGLSIYSLSYPRNYDKLTDLRKEILSTINTQKGTAKKATF